MSEQTRASKNGFWLLLTGTLTAVGASACCVIPLILLTLGIGGSWLSSLSLLEPYRLLFIGATVLLLALLFGIFIWRLVFVIPARLAPNPML